MAIGKSEAAINLKKLSIKFGYIDIVQNGKLSNQYNEKEAADYMKNSNIEINVNVGSGNKNFTAYTMDLTKKYIEINADYRS
jgi:glutamate N-acetyltransferase/amino-acid N-acetyltransferase